MGSGCLAGNGHRLCDDDPSTLSRPDDYNDDGDDGDDYTGSSALLHDALTSSLFPSRFGPFTHTQW